MKTNTLAITSRQKEVIIATIHNHLVDSFMAATGAVPAHADLYGEAQEVADKIEKSLVINSNLAILRENTSSKTPVKKVKKTPKKR